MSTQTIMLILLAGGMLLLIAAATHFSGQGSLDNIKSKTVGDGQHGTARWATRKEIQTTYIFTAAYNGVTGGFVIISADDPSMHSSQNEQDNRHYAKAAKLPMVEPSDSQECLDFMKAAYQISEQFDLPVLFRTTTRVSHSKSLVSFGQREERSVPAYQRNARKNIASPANAMKNHPKVEDAMVALAEYGCTSPLNTVEMNGNKIGVITASIAYQYAKDAFPADASFLKLGLTNPLPMKLIREFAAKVDKLYIIEELDGFMEEQIKAAGIDCVGKDLTGRLYELNPQVLKERIFGQKPETVDIGVAAVSRPPALCPGCPTVASSTRCPNTKTLS